IRGINIINLNLKGNTYTGGITGYNNGTVSDISVQGNITSFGECAGGVVGYNVVSKNATNLLVNINLEGNNFGDIGGTVGWNKGIVTGVVEAGTINSSHSNSGKGYGYASSGATTSIYYSSGVTGTARAKGTQFDVSNYNNLTSYDTYNLDTRIGGDNDSSGYYFDYNNTQSDIIVKSLEREPILILEPTNSIVSIRYGLSKPILDYYTTEYYVHPSQNINDVNIECRRARDNALVTNINELDRGINVVTCEITFTNIYGSHTTGPQQVMFKHWYYATNPTYSCPSGYALSKDDPDGTGEPVCRGIRESVLDIAEICGDYQTGSDNVRSTTLLAYRPSKGCYTKNATGFAQFGTDLGIFNETPTFGHGWNDQNDGGTIFSRRGEESWSEDRDNCNSLGGEGYYMAEPIQCREWTRGPDPTASGGTCNNSGTNDSGTTISPTLSSGRCYFD
ncbi:MAG: hypothetical protein GX641_01820, partial [Mollicutes bacterium]|nr:hypothetical protein [Mollicutes bacterium]